jgi:hypothetical protein
MKKILPLSKCFSALCSLHSARGDSRGRAYRQAGLPAQAGVTLIDTVVGTALMLVVFLGIAATIQLSIDLVINNRARAGAVALMNERMEYVRSLEYTAVGTVGGIPAGNIAQSESVELSDITYTRRTTIQYADDPEDGTNLDDENGIIVDYKEVRIAVSWSLPKGDRTVVMVARVEPLNGLEVDCDDPCGTIQIDVLDADDEPVLNAAVRVVNSSVSPTVDIFTYTDDQGRVTLAGAPASSGYEVYVSKTGYNSTQTYASSVENPNPVFSNGTVQQNQTWSVTFGQPDSGMDLLATNQIYTRTIVESGTWQDTMSDGSLISASSSVVVSGGTAHLADSESGYPSSGSLTSVTIAPTSLDRWKTFSWSGSEPTDTSLTFRFYDASGTLIPDSALPGNSAGFTTSSVELFGLSSTTYPGIRVGTDLASSDASSTPSVTSYDVEYASGPFAVGSIVFDMHGAKRIGLDPTIYKYDETGLSTGPSGTLVQNEMEWDQYTVTLDSGGDYDLAFSCPSQPALLSPGSTGSTYLYLSDKNTDTLVFSVTSGGSPVVGAMVDVTATGFHDKSATRSCGHTSFDSVSAGLYDYSVSATGYTTVNASATVSGLTTESVELTAL